MLPIRPAGTICRKSELCAKSSFRLDGTQNFRSFAEKLPSKRMGRYHLEKIIHLVKNEAERCVTTVVTDFLWISEKLFQMFLNCLRIIKIFLENLHNCSSFLFSAGRTNKSSELKKVDKSCPRIRMLITFTAAFAIEFVGQFLLFRILSFGKNDRRFKRKFGARCWFRTSDPCRVKAVLYPWDRKSVV